MKRPVLAALAAAGALCAAAPASALDIIPHPDEDRYATGGYTYQEGILWLGETRYVPPREPAYGAEPMPGDDAFARPAAPRDDRGWSAAEDRRPRRAHDRY